MPRQQFGTYLSDFVSSWDKLNKCLSQHITVLGSLEGRELWWLIIIRLAVLSNFGQSWFTMVQLSRPF